MKPDNYPSQAQIGHGNLHKSGTNLGMGIGHWEFGSAASVPG